MYDPEKHHRNSIRLKNYDYNDGFYYVTICCRNRAHIFGKVKDGIMLPNVYGKIAQSEWFRTAEIRDNVKLHEFVVMPNHIHGILKINFIHDLSLPRQFQNQGKKTLSSIVGAYKSAVSKQIHNLRFIGQIWQRGYYEHIVRDEQAYQNISQYIINNPSNWHKDDFYINA